MPFFTLPDGTRVHVRMPKPRARRCVGCGEFKATRLCDAPRPEAAQSTFAFARELKRTPRTTCSASVCDRCAIRVGVDHDYCPAHRQVAIDHAARLRRGFSPA